MADEGVHSMEMSDRGNSDDWDTRPGERVTPAAGSVEDHVFPAKVDLTSGEPVPR
jgi:hypothetical protein